jgi:protein-tyrosine-phosphatase
MPIRAGRPNGGEVLDEIGVPVVAEFPKPLTDEVVQAAELVITIGCGDACAIYPNRRYGVAIGRLHRTTPGGRTPHPGRYRRLPHRT